MDAVDVVRRTYRAALRGDDALLAGFAEDATWIEATVARTGRAELAAHFDEIDRDWRDWVMQDETYLSGGDTVVVRGTCFGTYRATGRTMSARFVHVWVLRGGLIARVEATVDAAAVRDAMMLGAA